MTDYELALDPPDQRVIKILNLGVIMPKTGEGNEERILVQANNSLVKISKDDFNFKKLENSQILMKKNKDWCSWRKLLLQIAKNIIRNLLSREW